LELIRQRLSKIRRGGRCVHRRRHLERNVIFVAGHGADVFVVAEVKPGLQECPHIGVVGTKDEGGEGRRCLAREADGGGGHVGGGSCDIVSRDVWWNRLGGC
jgi:hypothetical protein